MRVPRAVLVRAAPGAVGAAALGVVLWWWSRRHPTSRPFAQRWWVEFPHPFITQKRLRCALEPRHGQRVLSVGVGGGRYAVPVAALLGSTGAVFAVDLHLDMLELTRRRSGQTGLRTVLPLAADAQALPFDDDSFDAAWFLSSLGQVTDPTAALAEVARVVRPGGRVVVGEVAYDPHGVFFGDLRTRAADAGLEVATRLGGRLGYVARLTVPQPGRV